MVFFGEFADVPEHEVHLGQISCQGPRRPVVHSERRPRYAGKFPDLAREEHLHLRDDLPVAFSVQTYVSKDESMVWELFRARARADAQREPFSCIPGVEDILSGCDIILELFERVSFIGVDGRMSIPDVP